MYEPVIVEKASFHYLRIGKSVSYVYNDILLKDSQIYFWIEESIPGTLIVENNEIQDLV